MPWIGSDRAEIIRERARAGDLGGKFPFKHTKGNIYMSVLVEKSNSKIGHGSNDGDNGRSCICVDDCFISVTVILRVSVCMNYSKQNTYCNCIYSIS